ncbi:MAG: alkaline phosphatase family protein [Candidatus Eisenbacteria bacterium]|nr:alkaline phosphatase family protein [Candidatus Eisenbacteria bacterium]
MTSEVGPSGRGVEHHNHTIAALAPTLSALFGVETPMVSQASPLPDIVREARTALQDEPLHRCLVYAPDAVGLHLLQPMGHLFEEIRAIAPTEVHLRSMIPSKTPVCFASMFTGALPEVHGIRRPERPVLRCDTLFDALLRAGRRVAIVAVAGSSIDLIFRERAMDYFSEDYDPEVTEATLSLLELDHHDLIVAYHQEYDDALHETTPFSPRALRAAERHVAAFRDLAAMAGKVWRRHHHVVVFTPDHGACIDPVTGRGTHGGDSPEEMDVAHLWGFRRGQRAGKGVSGDAEDQGSI